MPDITRCLSQMGLTVVRWRGVGWRVRGSAAAALAGMPFADEHLHPPSLEICHHGISRSTIADDRSQIARRHHRRQQGEPTPLRMVHKANDLLGDGGYRPFHPRLLRIEVHQAM